MTSLSKTKAKKEAPKTVTLYLAHDKHYDEWEVYYTKRDVMESTSYDAYITIKVPKIPVKSVMPPCIGEVELEVVEEVA